VASESIRGLAASFDGRTKMDALALKVDAMFQFFYDATELQVQASGSKIENAMLNRHGATDYPR
jgi:hypothetical protein